MKFNLLGIVTAITTIENQTTGKPFIKIRVQEPHSYKAGVNSVFEIAAFDATISQCQHITEGMPVLVSGSADGELNEKGFTRVNLKLDRIEDLWKRAESLEAGPPPAKPPTAATATTAPAAAAAAPAVPSADPDLPF